MNDIPYSFRPTTSAYTAIRIDPLRRERRDAIERLIDSGFLYSRKLSVHNSCVNALTFSQDGKWLASAGDDPYILLWDFHQDDLIAASHALRGPRTNVFTLAFSASGQHLYSGDTGSQILKYDMTRLSSTSTVPPVDTIDIHRETIRAISCHPVRDELFLSASEDGIVLLHDSRADNSANRVKAARRYSEVTGVQFHPNAPHIFVTSESGGGVRLDDTRMAFGSRDSGYGEPVFKFVTTLHKPDVGFLAQPEASSVTFDRTGSRIAVTYLGYYPTIYSLDDPYPIAICSGRHTPEGDLVQPPERTYSNACTIKHGSFGGSGLDVDKYYTAGSDDFRAYIWKIPDTQLLKDERRVYRSSYDWRPAEQEGISGFSADMKESYVPMELSSPSYRVGGHQSIVNTSLMHPHWPFLVTAGVERHVILHSPLPDSPCAVDMSPTPREVRQLPQPSLEDRRRLMDALITGTSMTDESEDNTIALFDEILRQEGSGVNVFARRHGTM